MADIAYYLDDFCDEVMPCEASPDAWAIWLATAAPEWGRAAPAVDGQTFSASSLHFSEDIRAVFVGGEWRFSRDPAGHDFIAARFGEGTGWSPEDILSTENARASCIEWLDENFDAEHGDEQWFAVGSHQYGLRATYHVGPPATLTFVSVQ